MDQYIGSNKLATYLHPNSSDPFIEIKTESSKPPSPDLIDIRAFNSYYQQLVETSSSSSSSSSNISSHKPFVSSSESEENDCTTNLSTPTSSPKIKHIVPDNSFDQCISNDYPKIILNKQEHLLACHQNDDDITSGYQLSSKEKKIKKKLHRFFFEYYIRFYY